MNIFWIFPLKNPSVIPLALTCQKFWTGGNHPARWQHHSVCLVNTKWINLDHRHFIYHYPCYVRYRIRISSVFLFLNFCQREILIFRSTNQSGQHTLPISNPILRYSVACPVYLAPSSQVCVFSLKPCVLFLLSVDIQNERKISWKMFLKM